MYYNCSVSQRILCIRVDTRDNTVLHIFVADLKKRGKRALQLLNSQNSSDVTGVDTRDNVSRENKA